MNEYAIRFYSLINASLKLDALEKSELAHIALLPHTKADTVNKTLKMYNKFSEDPIEQLLMRDKDAGADDGLAKLQLIFGRKK